MGAVFEKVSKYSDDQVRLPARKTAGSAGYDFYVSSDTIVPPYKTLVKDITEYLYETETFQSFDEVIESPRTLDEVAELTSVAYARPTLVPTGIKAHLDEGTYLELSVRSSCPLKYWLILANAQGIIDSDYYNNPSNEGEIFFQMINLSPVPIILKAGDCIGQGIIHTFQKTANEMDTFSVRTGGFGSTSGT